MKKNNFRKAPRIKPPSKKHPNFMKEGWDGKPSKSPQTPMKKKTLSK